MVARQHNVTCQRGAFKQSYGNSNVKARLYSLSSDTFDMNIFSVTERKPTDPKSSTL